MHAERKTDKRIHKTNHLRGRKNKLTNIIQVCIKICQRNIEDKELNKQNNLNLAEKLSQIGICRL